MRCNKCGDEIPDNERFCPSCGHKLQSGRVADAEDDAGDDDAPADQSRLLDFQGWSKPGRGIGPYIEACIYAVILAGGIIFCLSSGLLWPLYPLIGVLGLAAWIRRL
jgi:hypothetical protein